jgi:mRNA interferase HigB
VRVIARGALNGFVKIRVPRAHQAVVKAQLDTWYEDAVKARWANSAELKAQYGTASIVSSERVVFNIKGNEYRMVVAINYRKQILMVKWMGTHKEYDKIDVLEVDYDKYRYRDSAH